MSITLNSGLIANINELHKIPASVNRLIVIQNDLHRLT